MTMTEATPVPTAVPLELHVEVLPDGHADAVTKVSWCVSRETITWLTEHDVVRPQMLIVVSSVLSEGVDEDGRPVRELRAKSHYVVPLEDGAQHVSFSTPGSNLITAAIVWHKLGKVNEIKWVMKDEKYFFDDMAHYGYKELLPSFYRISNRKSKDGERVKRFDYVAEVKVEVDEKFFAKQPPRWAMVVHDAFYQKRAFDQCHFWRHFLLALPAFCIVTPMYLLLEVIAYVGSVLYLMRGVSCRPLFHPLALARSQTDIWENCPSQKSRFAEYHWYKDSLWLYKKAKDENSIPKARAFPFWVINPYTVGLVWLTLWLSMGYHPHSHNFFVNRVWWRYLVASLAVHVALLVVILLLAAFAWLVLAVLNAVATDRPEKKEDDGLERRQQLAKQEQRLTQRVCTVDGSNKPPETVRIKAQALKARVCKPYASF